MMTGEDVLPMTRPGPCGQVPDEGESGDERPRRTATHQGLDGAEAAQAEHRRVPVPPPVVHRPGALTVGPMTASLYLAFTRYNLLSPPRFTGLDNFVRMFTEDPNYMPRRCRSPSCTCSSAPRSSSPRRSGSRCCWPSADRGLRGCPSTGRVFYLPSLIGASVAVAILWRQIFGDDGLVNRSWASSASTGRLDRRNPVHRARHPDPAARLGVRLPDGDLPRRPAADPDDLYEAAGSTAPARGGSSARSPCRC